MLKTMLKRLTLLPARHEAQPVTVHGAAEHESSREREKQDERKQELQAKKTSFSSNTESISAFTVGVLGAKGGSGASTLALNLSLALSWEGNVTTIVDGNLQQPDIGIMLGRQPQHSLTDFVNRRLDMDETVWSACRMSLHNDKFKSQCYLLSGPAGGEAARQINLSQLGQSLDNLRNRSEYILVDLPKNLDRHLVSMLDRLQCVLLIFDGTLSSIAAARRWLRIFEELGYSRSKIMLVHNRSGARDQDSQKDIPHLLSASASIRIPNAFAFLEDCCSSGEPALIRNPRNEYSRAVLNLARELGLIKEKLEERAE